MSTRTSRQDEWLESKGITARYEVELFSYYPSPTSHQMLQVSVQSATTTVGSNIVSQEMDLTGIMVWPATHLLCQYVASSEPLGTKVLELGCGCGLVGVTAVLSHPNSLWVSTDMDEISLEMCRHNYRLNGIEDGFWIHNLAWGSKPSIQSLQQQLFCQCKCEKFDAVVGADIIYPATCGKILDHLFETVDTLLREDGSFYLSFVTRDGPCTPQRLLEAASRAGFAISCLSTYPPDCIKQKLPPLLDAKILILQRSDEAWQVNNELGGDTCTVFPGLKASLLRREETSSEEEWQAPFNGSDTE